MFRQIRRDPHSDQNFASRPGKFKIIPKIYSSHRPAASWPFGGFVSDFSFRGSEIHAAGRIGIGNPRAAVLS
jgi:hypothetical protein